MLARIQQFIAITLFALLIASMWAGATIGFASLTVVYLSAVIGGYLVVLAIEFAWLQSSYAVTDALRPRPAQLLLAWVAEATAAPLVFLWRQPFRSRAEADYLPSTCSARRGVVLVHGFFCNRGLWNPWLQRLRTEGVPFVAVSLAPIFGSIDDYRQTIDDAARQIERVTGLPPVLVAHSMGGLAVRAWLSEVADAPCHRVVTIASPHAGTRLGAHGRGKNIAEMRVGSDWLARLGDRETAEMRRRFVCFWSHCDNIVFPTRNATLADADNRHLAQTPHVGMVYHPVVFDTVLSAVAA